MNKKRIISIILSWALILMTSLPAPVYANTETGWDGETTTECAIGDGSSTTPYEISTPEELAWARDAINAGTHNTAHFKLTADIDLNNQEWVPIGYGENSSATTLFKGTFDGNGHKVKNVTITTATTGGTGFFGVVYVATVKNFGIENINISVSTGNVGGMVGRAIGTFENCYVINSTLKNTTTTTGSEYSSGLGGFVGNQWGTITATNCYVYDVDITAAPRGKIGGFCGIDQGTNDTGVYTNCYTAEITEVQTEDVKTPVRYGFTHKNSTTDGTSAVNCFSTLASGAGTYSESEARAYNAELELGTASATKDDIVAALVTNLEDTVYAVNEDINGGYPYINYNVIIPTPEATPETTPEATPEAGWDGETTTECTIGDGSSSTPYEISTPEELAWARDAINAGTHNSKCFKLTADIDLNNCEWIPIGISTNKFSGTFDGNGKVVSNITITTAATEGTGFFGVVNDGTVKNLGIDNINIMVPSGNVGGMVGKAIGTFTNCYVKNSTLCHTTTTTSSEYSSGVGGFVGYAWSAVNATNCYVYNIDITAPPRGKLGGFCGIDQGSNDNGVYTNCYAAMITEVPIGTAKTPVRYGFAQRMSTTDGTTAVNCFSTLASGTGTHGETGGRAYNAELELGTASATKDDIVAALVTNLEDTVYAVDPDINGGYPYIDYSVAAPAPTPEATPTSTPEATPGTGETPPPTPTATPTPIAGVPTPNPSGWDGTAATGYAGGNGSAESPYLIATAAQLAYAREMINAGTHKSKTFELASDIDWNNHEWTPIGLNDANNFAGTFNGAGFTIKNVVITQNFSYTGVFGHLNGAKVSNLGVEHMYIYKGTGGGPVGGMMGRGAATFENCYIKDLDIISLTTTYIGIGMFVSTVRTASSFTNCYVYNARAKAQNGSTIGGFANSIENPQTSVFTKCYVSNVTPLEGNKATVYPFGRNATDAAQTVTNCFSDVTPADGTDSRYPYNESQAFGTAGATKEQITTALVTADQIMWATDASINNGYPYLTFKFPMEPDEEAVYNDREALELDVTQPIRAAFSLPTTGENGSTITWTSDNPAIIVSDGSASVICQDDEVQVTLTATLTKGNYKKAKVFNVTVAEIIVSYVAPGNVTYTDNGNGTTTVTMPIECTGLQYASYNNISFWVTLVDANGEIIDQDVETKPKKTGDNQIDSFSVTLDTKGTGQEYKYYLWGDNNISLVDNTPTAIENLTPIEKVKNVTLNWDACYDDSGDPVIYKVYRDDTEYLGETYGTTFKADGGSSSETHTYKVVPTDKRAQLGASATTGSTQMIDMFYIKASGAKNGISTSFTAGPDNDSYAETKEIIIDGSTVKVFTSNGFKSDNITQRSHMIYFTVDSSLIKQTDNELVFEIVYYDKGEHKIQFIYNGKRPLGADGKPVADTSALARFKGLEKTTGGTNALITDVIRVGDAELRKSNQSSGGDFGIIVPGGVQWGDVAIKEIRVIQAGLYD